MLQRLENEPDLPANFLADSLEDYAARMPPETAETHFMALHWPRDNNELMQRAREAGPGSLTALDPYLRLQQARIIVAEDLMRREPFPALLALIMHDAAGYIPLGSSGKAVIEALKKKTNTMNPVVFDGLRRHQRLSQMYALMHEIRLLFSIDNQNNVDLKNSGNC